MSMVIDGIDFEALESEKYWSFPASYKKDPKTETKNMIFSGDYAGARKMDGAYYRFIKDMNGNMRLQGRSKSVNGGYLDKLDHVPHLLDFFNAMPNGTCLLGEVYFPNNEGSNKVTTIMGCLTSKALARQEAGEKLHYYIFDVWAFGGKSMMKEKFINRVKMVHQLAKSVKTKYVDFAEYYDGAGLWDLLGRTLAAGGEGIVITKKDSIPEPGKRTARKTLKVKKEVAQTIDCFFTGRCTRPTREYTGKELETWTYWENTITGEKLKGEFFEDYKKGSPIQPVTKPHWHSWAGSLEIGVLRKTNGKIGEVFSVADGVVAARSGYEIVPIGFLSGLSDEIKSSPTEYANKPIEITAMEIFKDENGKPGGLRHAKLVQFRPDLSIEDCTWKKIFG